MSSSASMLIDRVKNPVLPHGASSKEKGILTLRAVWRTNDVRWLQALRPFIPSL